MQKKIKSDNIRLSNEESNKLTKQSLQTALIYLMNKKPFEQITITELVNKAGVSRMSFYRNYTSKEDILKKIKNEVLDSLKTAFINLKNGHGSYEIYYKIFCGIQNQADTISLLLKANFATTFMFENILFFDNIVESKNIKDYYNFIACVGAILSIVTRWLVDGMKESVEFMANYCATNIGFY